MPKNFIEPPSSEITPEALYLNRRAFMKAAGLIGASAVLAACAPQPAQPAAAAGTQAPSANGTQAATTPGLKDELGDPANTFDEITNYNNYYEFSQGKEEVAPMSKNFKTSPWKVEVSGMVQNPQTYAVEDILKKFPQEERIYRLRCVEAWSMVIPWTGFPLAKLLNEVQPTSSAKYVKFLSAALPGQMPGLDDPMFPWPYTEGLRLDEAMNDLALLVTGLYGKPLPNQDGAPIRLIVPWKYGFKSAKALIKIELTDVQPSTFWATASPMEYGFYSNVNPDVPHPRWSQDTERRIGELSRRKTLKFNGYGAQVAQLYAGMDLRANF
jgi:sulfoxide reductase catalytic subunit YedY